jgi:hypothetical protein
MRYVLAWRNGVMSAPSSFYYDVDKKGNVAPDRPIEGDFNIGHLAGDVAACVADGSLVYFRPVKEN